MPEEIKGKEIDKSIIWNIIKDDMDLILFAPFLLGIGYYFLGGILVGFLITYFLIKNFEHHLNVGKKFTLNFKYNIGDSTNKGIIKSRYYLESKNRNGGDVSGDFYVMENGKSYNEILLEEK